MVQIFIDTKVQTKELNRAIKQLQKDITSSGTETIKTNAILDLAFKKGSTGSLTESLKQAAKNTGGTGFFINPTATLVKQKEKKSGAKSWVLASEQVETKKGVIILPAIDKRFKSKEMALKSFNRIITRSIVKFLTTEMRQKSKKKLIPGISSLGKVITVVIIDESSDIGINATNAAILLRARALAKKKKEQPVSRGKIISSAQFSAILRTRISATSPHGPVGGRPLSGTQLTHRTQRYLKSIKVTALRFNAGQVVKSAKEALIVRYLYHPLYTVHESKIAQGRRAPSRKIDRTIRQIVRGLFGANIKVQVTRDN